MFQLQSSSIYLVNEVDDLVVFPDEPGGRFNHVVIDCTATYSVQGDDLNSEQTSASGSQLS